jgi:integration host factor subunit alpha
MPRLAPACASDKEGRMTSRIAPLAISDADEPEAAAASAGGSILPSLETPTLTKAELAELLFDNLGLNKRESKDMVEAFFDIVHSALVEGQDVKLSGFGNFNIRRKAPRPGRNPRTGEAIPIKARKVVTFHASHKLKAQVQGEVPPPGDFE